MSDEVIDGKYRGWADRVADVMTTAHADFTYVNLAVRGKLISQVVEGQVPIALSYVTGPETLVSFHAGANDALRPGYQASVAIPLYQEAVRMIAKSDATLMLFTVLENTGNKGRGSELWEKRFSEFNQGVRQVGAEVGADAKLTNPRAGQSPEVMLSAKRRELQESEVSVDSVAFESVSDFESFEPLDSPSLRPFSNSPLAEPRERASLGSLDPPKSKATITRTMTSSVPPGMTVLP